MKESFVNRSQAVVANDQAAIVAEPSEGAFDLPAAPVAAQCSTILGARLAPIPSMRRNQFDASCGQLLAQRITVIGGVPNHALRFLAWPPAAMPPAHADRRELFFREPDLVRGRRVKLLSQSPPTPRSAERNSLQTRKENLARARTHAGALEKRLGQELFPDPNKGRWGSKTLSVCNLKFS
jgi:hypothetical protein